MNKWIFGTAILCLASIAAAIGFYVYSFCFLNTDKSALEQWGQTGDFFGGVLNPTFAFLSFMALLYSIHVQRKEQMDFFEEAKKQRAQDLNIQKYNFVHSKIDYRFKMIEELLRRSFVLKDMDGKNIFPNLMTFFVFTSKHIGSNISESDSVEEAHFRAFDTARNAAISAFSVSSDLKENVEILLSEYNFEVRSLLNIYNMYLDISEDLGLKIEKDPIAKPILSSTGIYLSFAYILNRVVMHNENSNFTDFIPDKEKQKILFAHFIASMENLNLPKLAIEYIKEFKNSV